MHGCRAWRSQSWGPSLASVLTLFPTPSYPHPNRNLERSPDPNRNADPLPQEVARVSLMRDRRYQDYFDFLDQHGGIYLHRWGDAPIRWLGLAMFLPRENVYRVNETLIGHAGWKGR